MITATRTLAALGVVVVLLTVTCSNYNPADPLTPPPDPTDLTEPNPWDAPVEANLVPSAYIPDIYDWRVARALQLIEHRWTRENLTLCDTATARAEYHAAIPVSNDHSVSICLTETAQADLEWPQIYGLNPDTGGYVAHIGPAGIPSGAASTYDPDLTDEQILDFFGISPTATTTR